MRLTAPILTGFAALALAVAGCSSAGSPTVPAVTSPQIQTDRAPAPTTPDSSGACRARTSCPAKLIVPLTFDGRRFAIGKYGSCKTVSLSDAKRFTAGRTRRLFLHSSVTLKAQCIPASRASRLFIAVAEIGRSSRTPGALEVDSTGTRVFFTPLGQLVNTGKDWTFHATGLGTKLNANAKYVFYVVSAPFDTASAGNFLLLQPLSFNGTTFSVVPDTCFQGDPEDAPAYTAPASGQLTLGGTVSVTPTCVPSPLPSSLPQLFIVAVNVDSQDDVARVTPAQRKQHFMAMRPMDDNLGMPAVEIAGPVNVTDNPWNFAPDSPGLTMTAGANYAFFIAAALPPPPLPTQSFGEVMPLNFDGTTFTVPAISSCSTLPTAAPYAAPTSAPLTLGGSVSITPDCIPSSSSSSSSSSSGGGQLYIVAAVTCSTGGGDDSSSGSSSNSGNGCCSGTSSSSDSSSNSGNCCSSSSSNSSSCGSNGQDSVRRPHDGGNCSTGLMGGGDDIARMRPSDGSYNGTCTIHGYAIAGPVNPGANPWIFAPLTPPLNLTGGSQYTFYVGIANQNGDSQGGDN